MRRVEVMASMVVVLVGCAGEREHGAKNTPPTAMGISITTVRDQTVQGTLIGLDPDGDPVGFLLTTRPARGEVTLDGATGVFTYRPHDGILGRDSFGWVVRDPDLAESGEATALVEILIPAPDQAFDVVKNQYVEGTIRVDHPGSVVFEVLGGPAIGTLDLDAATGAFTYTPDPNAVGYDAFTFIARDGELSSEVGMAAFEIAVVSAPHASLRAVLTDVLRVGPSTFVDPTCGLADGCPRTNPIEYFDVHVALVDGTAGAAAFATPPGPLTPHGYEAWLLASSSACGRMMLEQTPPALFPNGVSSYSHLYQVLLAREPSATEIARLDSLRTAFPDDPRRGAAICASVLGSLEFLSRH